MEENFIDELIFLMYNMVKKRRKRIVIYEVS